MQNQAQSVTALTGQMPGGGADGEIVLLERVFKQRRISARPGAGQQLPSENLLERSNIAFLRKDLPVGALEELVGLCAGLMACYARAARICEAHPASYELCVMAHKRTAFLSDALNRLRGVNAVENALYEKRRAIAVVFETVFGAADYNEEAASRDFKKCLNDDALPVDFRVGLAVLYAQIRQSLRQAQAIRRSVDEV